MVSMGIDKSDGLYEVSVQVPNPGQIAGGGGGGDGGGAGGGGSGAVEVYTGKGATIEAAIGELDRKSVYPLFFGHMETLLFGEKLAKEGILPFMDWIRRNPEIRRQMYPIVVAGKTKDALLVQPKLERIPIYYLRNFIEAGIEINRLSDMTLGKVFVDLGHPGKQVPMLYYIKPREGGFEYKGMAIFRRDRMIGSLDYKELNPVLHYRESRPGYPVVVTCPHEKGKLVFEPRKVKKELSVSDRPEATVRITIQGMIMENSCKFAITDEKAIQKVNQMITHYYDQTAKRVLRKAQKVFKEDVFLIRNRVYAFYPRIWNKTKWPEAFPTMPVHIHYKVEVNRIGLKAQ